MRLKALENANRHTLCWDCFLTQVMYCMSETIVSDELTLTESRCMYSFDHLLHPLQCCVVHLQRL